VQGIEISYVLGREQSHGDGLVAEIGPAASSRLPITAKPYVMQALLPTDHIIQVIAPAKDGSSGGNSYEEVGGDGNGGRTDSQTPWTV
jgi:hypothetical protein